MNEVFQTGTLNINSLLFYIADTIMDVGYSMLYLDKVGNISNLLISAAIGGTIDAGVDIIQTMLFFSPKAQQRISKINAKNNNNQVITYEIPLKFFAHTIISKNAHFVNDFTKNIRILQNRLDIKVLQKFNKTLEKIT